MFTCLLIRSPTFITRICPGGIHSFVNTAHSLYCNYPAKRNKEVLSRQTEKHNRAKKVNGEGYLLHLYFLVGKVTKCLYNFLIDSEMIRAKENRHVEHTVLHMLTQ